MSEQPFRFRGFLLPTTTPVPDQLFDELLGELTGAEVKALLYIIRRTFGFKKSSDPISFNQFLKGITTRDGRTLDRGCGVKDRTTLSKSLAHLEQMGIITSAKGQDERGENETTVYALQFAEQLGGVVGKPDHGSRETRLPVVGKPDYQVVGKPDQQETVEQQTVKQHGDQPSGENWKDALGEQMTAANFQQWIDPLQIVELANSHAVLQAPTAAIASYVGTRLADKVAGALGVERIEVRTLEEAR